MQTCKSENNQIRKIKLQDIIHVSHSRHIKTIHFTCLAAIYLSHNASEYKFISNLKGKSKNWHIVDHSCPIYVHTSTFKREERRREEADLGDWTVCPLPTFLELLLDSADWSPFSAGDSCLWSLETEATGADREIIEESWSRDESCKEIPGQSLYVFLETWLGKNEETTNIILFHNWEGIYWVYSLIDIKTSKRYMKDTRPYPVLPLVEISLSWFSQIWIVHCFYLTH